MISFSIPQQSRFEKRFRRKRRKNCAADELRGAEQAGFLLGLGRGSSFGGGGLDLRDLPVHRDELAGALLGAQAAADALVVVDDGQVLVHRNGFLGAGLGAQAAADTAVVADLADHHTLVLGGAGDGHMALGLIGGQKDDVPGTGVHALLTGFALLLVHLGHAVHHVDGVEGADLLTGAQTQAAVGAAGRTSAGQPGRGGTVGDAHIVVLLPAAAAAGALHLGDLFDGRFRLHAHNLGDLGGHGVTAGGTSTARPIINATTADIT